MMRTEALAACFSPPLLKRSLIVALVVGSILVAINQGDVILAGGSPNWWKIALTYIVPFVVSSHGAYSALAAKQS